MALPPSAAVPWQTAGIVPVQTSAAIPWHWQVLGVAFGTAVIATQILLGYWVYRDASARGSSNPRFWGVAVAVVGLVFLSYWYNRWRRLGERAHPRTRRDRAAETVILAVVGAEFVGAVAAPPDALSLPLTAAGALLVTLPLAYLLVYRDGYARVKAAV